MKIVIVAARRTPIGSFQGAFKDTSAVALASAATTAILGGLPVAEIADVIVGNVLQAGQGMNPARQIALQSGLAITVPGQTVNRVCASGMQAVVSAVQALRAGDSHLYLAGGTESMSRAPFLLNQLRSGHKIGNVEMMDSMVHDGLTDPTHRYHMGVTAENLAARWNISRAEQDAFALESHRRAVAAQKDGAFAGEIVPVAVPSRRGEQLISEDENPRPDSSLEALARLRPVFQKEGTVTAGNASGLNDGAAMLALATADYAEAQGLKPLAEILGYATTGVDPAVMGIGPVTAIPLALGRAGLAATDVDLYELNEAFAVQSLAVCRDLNLSTEKVNLFGGAISLGHPIGASGARVLVTLVHALRTRKQEHGVASLCVGGGMGIAMVVRNLS